MCREEGKREEEKVYWRDSEDKIRSKVQKQSQRINSQSQNAALAVCSVGRTEEKW